MKRSKFSEEQIIYAIKQVEVGVPIAQLCRKYGISQQTFYRWRNKYGGLAASELKRLKELERENTQLKKLVADLSLDKQILAGGVGKKRLKPARKRQLVGRAQDRYQVSERRACGLMQIQRSSHRYRSRRDPQDGLRLRLRDLAAVRPRYGYRRLHILLRREGMTINHKIVLRLYREENLQVRHEEAPEGDSAPTGTAASSKRAEPSVESGLRIRRAGKRATLPGIDGHRYA